MRSPLRGIRKSSVKVFRVGEPTAVAEPAIANRFLSRLKGLIGTPALRAGAGLVIPACNSIHMYFMSYPIDVVFLRETTSGIDQSEYTISSLYSGVRPWRVLPLSDFSAHHVIELAEGEIRKHELQEGTRLCIV